MQVPFVIEASMGATHAPGTILRQVSGKPVLGYLVESLRQCPTTQDIVVVTTDQAVDDPLGDYCQSEGFDCVRVTAGDLATAYERLLAAGPVDGFVRLSQVSPLLDYRLVDRALNLFGCELPDLVTNRHPATFPTGEVVEVVSAETLRSALPKLATPAERGDITAFYYSQPRRFRIINFSAPRDLSSLRLSVETEEEFADFVSTVMRMTRPHWSYTFEDSLALATGILA